MNITNYTNIYKTSVRVYACVCNWKLHSEIKTSIEKKRLEVDRQVETRHKFTLLLMLPSKKM